MKVQPLPYQGPMLQGALAFQQCRAITDNPYSVTAKTKHARWEHGWRKAKLAREQGKKSV